MRRDGIVEAWLKFAAVDLAAADAPLGIDRDDIDPWVMAFHAQQAAEKAVKALLLSIGIEFPLTHDLATLLGRLPAAIAGCIAPEAAGSTVFAVGVRYPTAGWDPMATDNGVEHADAVAAVNVAHRFLVPSSAVIADSRDGAP